MGGKRDEVGLHVHHNATDKYIFSPWTACNDNVFVNSDVLEVFLAPVKQPYDVPQYYHEIGPCMTRASCSRLTLCRRADRSNSTADLGADTWH